MGLVWMPSFPEWTILLATLCVLLYKYATRHKDYWKKQNIPYEKLSLFFGSTLQFMLKPWHLVELELYRKHGRVFGSFEDGIPTLYVGEPDLIKQVLVKDFTAVGNRNLLNWGDTLLENIMSFAEYNKWKRLRSASVPALSTAKLRKMHSFIEHAALTTCEYLKDAANDNRDEDVKRVFNHFTLATISSFAFGAELEQYTPETEELVSVARDSVFAEITFFRALKVLTQSFMNILHINFFKREAFHLFEKVVLAVLEKRKDTTQFQNHEDFLHLMLKAKKKSTEDTTLTNNNVSDNAKREVIGIDNEEQTKVPEENKGLTEEEVIAQCVLFFIAGQDPTSSAAALTAYLLALHPDVQDKLRAEVDACVDKHGLSPGHDVISKLNYLNAVVCESLRLIGPNVRLERSPREDGYVLGDTGIKVPKGSLIVIPVSSVHLDPEFFPDPLRFNPDRFSEENIGTIHPYSYLPFGAGPRNCFGMRLGIIMVKTGLFHAVRTVKFVQTSKTKVPLDFRRGYGVLAPKNIVVGIRKRNL